MLGPVTRRAGYLLAALVLVSAPGVGQQPAAQQRASGQPAPASARLSRIVSWAYQLQSLDISAAARSPFDLIVTDLTQVTDAAGRPRMPDMRRLKLKPDGGRRFVLAYLSIGEAETYRLYWRKDWVEPVKVVLEKRKEQFVDEPRPGTAPGPPETRVVVPEPVPQVRVLHYPRLTAPVWLGHENDAWPTNYHVRYWEKGWQDIIFGAPGSYLERIMAAGFDGIYLDRVDAFYGADEGRPGAKQDMVAFVLAIARQARRHNPAFVVVPQNGEELLLVPEYLAEIDGIAKEDLFFGYNDGERNPPLFVRNSLDWLAAAKQRGLPVLVVEYLREPGLIAQARAQILEQGFVPYFSERPLDRLVTGEAPAAPPLPVPSPAGQPKRPQR